MKSVLLTTNEAAVKLGVTGTRVRQLIADGRLPAEKIGGRNLIRREDLGAVRLRPNGRPPKSRVTS